MNIMQLIAKHSHTCKKIVNMGASIQNDNLSASEQKYWPSLWLQERSPRFLYQTGVLRVSRFTGAVQAPLMHTCTLHTVLMAVF